MRRDVVERILRDFIVDGMDAEVAGIIAQAVERAYYEGLREAEGVIKRRMAMLRQRERDDGLSSETYWEGHLHSAEWLLGAIHEAGGAR